MTVFRKMVAYKPIGLTDYSLFVTDKDNTGRPAKIGFGPRIDMDNSGAIGTADVLNTIWCGPMKFNSPLELTGGNSSTAASPTAATAGTHLVLTPSPTVVTTENPVSGAASLATDGGYLRDDKFEAAQGISETGGAVSTAVHGRDPATGLITGTSQLLTSADPSFDTLGGRVLDGSQEFDSTGISRYCTPIAAPELFPKSVDRYRALTRDSGSAVLATVNGEATSVNLG